MLLGSELSGRTAQGRFSPLSLGPHAVLRLIGTYRRRRACVQLGKFRRSGRLIPGVGILPKGAHRMDAANHPESRSTVIWLWAAVVGIGMKYVGSTLLT